MFCLMKENILYVKIEFIITKQREKIYIQHFLVPFFHFSIFLKSEKNKYSLFYTDISRKMYFQQ